ncbi:methane monooxygenase/ammonia monooxygenase subunit B [Candidatus Methylacidiphilum infernorum]|uniref:Methane monooxygenase/ammonia monooxygenase subunit B n=1 Tax=Candidatus Methylacidiphilum infernorum TaxID=511746 RepID=A0ABX7PX10_9BACT|nr:bacterial ammonia monooxygenase, subunit AmoB [Candidatus Methylacidiphilum infernorum]QSR87101.1 methane monooxygenase/ammonia monooxygenase subunit B [Candidatus Methylacidiphilum infernorum]
MKKFNTETGMKRMKKIVRMGGALLLSGLMLTPLSSLFAIQGMGAKSQEAFLRMRTVTFFDTRFSFTPGNRVKVGDEFTCTGKVMLMPTWPQEIPFSGISFFNFFVPGPQVLRKAIFVNEKYFQFNSVVLEKGGVYEYKMINQARYPGVWPVGPMLSMEEAGPFIGPEEYLTIEGSYSGFTNPVKTLLGNTIDLENYGEARMIMWTLLTTAVAVAWLVYWCSKPFTRRLGLVAAGRKEDLFSPMDRQVCFLFTIGTIVLVAAAAMITRAQYPITIPIQETKYYVKPLPPEPSIIQAEVTDATYDVPGRTLSFHIQVKNVGDKPVVLKEFLTANVRFLNPDVPGNTWNENYPEVNGGAMIVKPSEPINPGETKTLEVSMQSAEWENQRLTLYHESTNRFGGLLFFSDTSGTRQVYAIADQIVIPKFGAGIGGGM